MSRITFDFKGILNLLAKNLYDEPDVFVRELLQNGHDAIAKRVGLEPNHAGKIEIIIDSSNSIIIFKDNGIGMDENDLENYLSRVGKSDKDGNNTKALIGQFGIGFLSGFIVAEHIEVVTRKLYSENVYKWNNNGDEEYQLTRIEIEHQVGTTVTLKLDSLNSRFLEESEVEKNIIRYADFLPYPIFLNYRGPINAQKAPWHFPAWSTKTEAENIDFNIFLRKRFLEDIPLLVIPIDIEFPSTKGLLYVTDSRLPSLTSMGLVDIFQKRMCVRLNDRDLLPDWAKFVRGVIDSNEITPTAARDNIVKDENYYELRDKIGKCIINAIVELSRKDGSGFQRLCDFHSYHILGMMLKDDSFFQAIIELFPFTTNTGKVNLKEYREQQIPRPGEKLRICYFTGAADSNKSSTIYHDQGVIAICVDRVFVKGVLN